MKTNDQLIKKAKETGNYQNIYPIAYIDGIIDKESNEKLSDILIRYNHILVPWQGSVTATRNRVTLLMRRQGLWITYLNEDSEIVTEVYKGSAKDIITNWADDINWEIIPDMEYVQNNASKIPDGAILPQHLSKELQEMLLSSGKVTNLPDNEDLTTQGIALKFKDREYNPEQASGKGYKILRKNWTIVNNRNINLLTQEMINDIKTVYEIRYDFNLNGQTINIPNGSILDFKGGSIDNGTINFPEGTYIRNLYKGTATITGSPTYIDYLADEEDVTTENGILKFKDKEYSSSNFSGLGRKYLRKNIVDGKNILTQDMINSSNTIYIIQYDYDLNEETVIIPEGCVLQFEGGSINNGTLILNNTFINDSTEIFGDELSLRGTIKNIELKLNWFPVSPKKNCTSFLSDLLLIADNSWGGNRKIVELVGENILVDPDTIHVKNCSLHGNKCIIESSKSERTGSGIIIDDMDVAFKHVIQDLYITGFNIGIDIQAPISLDRIVSEYNNIGCYLSGPAYSSYIINCRFTNNYYYGLEAAHNKTNNEDHYDTIVQRSYMAGNGRIGAFLHSIHGINIKFSYCDFEANGRIYGSEEINTGYGVVVTTPPLFFTVEHSWFEPEGTADGIGILIGGPSDDIFQEYLPEIYEQFNNWGIADGTVYTGKINIHGNAYLGCNGVLLCLKGNITTYLGDDNHTRDTVDSSYFPYKIIASPYTYPVITIDTVIFPTSFIGVAKSPIKMPQFDDNVAGIDSILYKIKFNGEPIYNSTNQYAIFNTGHVLQLSEDGNPEYIPYSTISIENINSGTLATTINSVVINDATYSYTHNIMMPRFLENEAPVDLSNKYLVIIGDGGLYWYFDSHNTLRSSKVYGPISIIKLPELGVQKEVYFSHTFIRAAYYSEEEFKTYFNSKSLKLTSRFSRTHYERYNNEGFWKYDGDTGIMSYKEKDDLVHNIINWRNSDGTLTSKVAII